MKVNVIFKNKEGVVINPGDTITSFRGEDYIFKGHGGCGATGNWKVSVQSKYGTYSSIFYPSVFGLTFEEKELS